MNKIVVASNRGPVHFKKNAQNGWTAVRSGGGLATALSDALAGQDLIWIAAASSDEDRALARQGEELHRLPLAAGEIKLRLLDFPPETHDSYYNSISNRYLWFVHLRLFDLIRYPQFDDQFYRAWDMYCEVNKKFAESCDSDANTGGEVFIHDYHLALVPGMLRKRRDDLAIAHFTHIPWADPTYFSILPSTIAGQLLEGMLGADLVGFLSPRWSHNFLRCCEYHGYGIDWESSTVHVASWRRVSVRSYPLGIDAKQLWREASELSAERCYRELIATYSKRVLLARVERMEPAKNLLRGLRGFELFLDRRPYNAKQFAHFVLAFESRGAVTEYRSYRADVEEIVQNINKRSGTGEVAQVILEQRSNLPLARAVMRRMDVLVVNSLGDGMNLVAKEGMVLGTRDPVLILSREAGAADQLGASALLVNPFDTAELADAIDTAVTMPQEERAHRAQRLRELAVILPPREWFAIQCSDLHACTHAYGKERLQCT
jgi:trehalose 6-phosphate synthase